MVDIVAEQLRVGGAVHIGGKYVATHEIEQSFDAYPFVDVSSNEEKESFERLRNGSQSVIHRLPR
jgi:hypothetical protein